MWKCDYKLLKAPKRTVNRRHHETVYDGFVMAANSLRFTERLRSLKWDVVVQYGFCLHFHTTSFVEIFS